MDEQARTQRVTMLDEALLNRMELCATRHTLTGWYGGGEWQGMYEHDVPLLIAEIHVARAEHAALLAAHTALVERARVLQEVAIDSLLDINYVRSVQPNIYLDRVADALAELATAAPPPAGQTGAPDAQ